MRQIIDIVSIAIIAITFMPLVMYIIPIPIQSVLCLVVTFVLSSIVMIAMGAEYIGLIFRVVYVGAIAVLFLFVVMILHYNIVDMRSKRITVYLTTLFGYLLTLTVMDYLYGRAYTSTYVLNTRVKNELLFDKEPNRFDNLMNVVVDDVIVYDSIIDNFDSNIDLESLGQIIYTHYGIYVIMAGFVLLVGMIGSIVLTRKVRTVAIAARQQAHQQTARDMYNAVILVPGKGN